MRRRGAASRPKRRLLERALRPKGIDVDSLSPAGGLRSRRSSRAATAAAPTCSSSRTARPGATFERALRRWPHDPDFFVHARGRARSEVLPWDFLDHGLRRRSWRASGAAASAGRSRRSARSTPAVPAGSTAPTTRSSRPAPLPRSRGRARDAVPPARTFRRDRAMRAGWKTSAGCARPSPSPGRRPSGGRCRSARSRSATGPSSGAARTRREGDRDPDGARRAARDPGGAHAARPLAAHRRHALRDPRAVRHVRGRAWCSRGSTGWCSARADPKAGAVGSLLDLSADPRLNHRFPVEPGRARRGGGELLRAFFRARRGTAHRAEAEKPAQSAGGRKTSLKQRLPPAWQLGTAGRSVKSAARRAGRAWSKAPDSKSGVPATVPGVRIPRSPPHTRLDVSKGRIRGVPVDREVSAGGRVQRYRSFEEASAGAAG